MKIALAKHDSILMAVVEPNNGQIVKTTGEGIHAVFGTVIDAVNASLYAKKMFQTSEVFEASEAPIHFRMGLHKGEAELRDGDY